MTVAKDLRNIVEALDGHIRADFPMGVSEIASLAAELEAIAMMVERMEAVTGIAAATLALERIEQMEAQARAARLQ